MITKKLFLRALSIANKLNEFVDKLYELKVDIIESCVTLASGLIVSILDKSINANGMLLYWCYELDYGNRYTDGCVTDENNNNIDISNIDKLWLYLNNKTGVND